MIPSSVSSSTRTVIAPVQLPYEVVSFDEGSVVLRVPRADTAAAAACMLDTYSVADLAIEEMDIGTIIERIMVRRRGDVA